MLTAKLFFGITVPVSLAGYLLVKGLIGTPLFLSFPAWLAVFAGLWAASVLILMSKAENEEEEAIESYRK